MLMAKPKAQVASKILGINVILNTKFSEARISA